MTDEQVLEFREQGVLVVRGALDPSEVARARSGLHECLRTRAGVDLGDLEGTAGGLRGLSSTGGSGGVLDIFYEPFQIRVATNDVCFRAVSQLWAASFASAADPLFRHRHGPFDPSRGYAYLDRVCFRVPTRISELHATGTSKRCSFPLQRSLTPHFDCCPADMDKDVQGGKAVAKWRPLQAFVSLTDTFAPEMGGFEAANGFHKGFEAWARDRPPQAAPRPAQPGSPGRTKAQRRAAATQAAATEASATKAAATEVSATEAAATEVSAAQASVSDAACLTPAPPVRAPCLGEFTPVRPREDADVLARVTHVGAGAGDLVVWDSRIPHGNSRTNASAHSREVVFVGLLPAVPLNAAFAVAQRSKWEAGVEPVDQWVKAPGGVRLDKYAGSVDDLTPLGRRLLGIDPWP